VGPKAEKNAIKKKLKENKTATLEYILGEQRAKKCSKLAPNFLGPEFQCKASRLKSPTKTWRFLIL
jgi:hypothetical protein